MKKIFMLFILLFVLSANLLPSFSNVPYQAGVFQGFDKQKKFSGIRTWGDPDDPNVSLNETTDKYLYFKIDNAVYRLQFNPILFWRFPMDLKIGQTYNVRINSNKDRVYILKPNGDEIKTIVAGVRAAN